VDGTSNVLLSNGAGSTRGPRERKGEKKGPEKKKGRNNGLGLDEPLLGGLGEKP